MMFEAPFAHGFDHDAVELKFRQCVRYGCLHIFPRFADRLGIVQFQHNTSTIAFMSQLNGLCLQDDRVANAPSDDLRFGKVRGQRSRGHADPGFS